VPRIDGVAIRSGVDVNEDAGLDARLYGLIHRGNPGDVSFYVRVCRGAATVLEIGCGAGRVLLPIAAAGSEATGLDVDPGQLAEAARAERAAGVRVRWVEGDMRRFDLGTRFDRIVAPYHTLFALIEDADLASCLACVREHLVPGGRFAFDGYRLDGDVDPGEDGPAGPPEPLATIVDGEDTVRVFEQDRWGPGPGRVDVTYTFHVHRPGAGVRVRTQVVRHRIRTSRELAAAVAAAGLRAIEGPTPRHAAGAGTWFTFVVERPRA